MFNRFEFKVGLRYLRSKQKDSFVSFISLVSIIGIALGVAALITVLSVMNGFQREIRSKIIGVTAHIQIMNAAGQLPMWQAVGAKARTNPHVLAYAPYIDGQALVSFDGNVNGVVVRGINTTEELGVDDIVGSATSGSFGSLTPGSYNIIVGRELARSLGVMLGDKITLITPDGQSGPVGMVPRLKQFTITGIFDSHMYEYNSGLVFVDLRDAGVLFRLGDMVSGVRVKVDDVMRTPYIKEELQKLYPDDVIINDWIDQHQNYFEAVALEKKMMFVILTLIIAVAVFNLVSTLVMTVSDKRSDIAILRTLGASKRNIMNIFVIQGGVSGIIGTLSGTILGLILAFNIGRLVHWIEVITGTKLINGDVYLISYLPSQVVLSDVVSIFTISIILSILATIYPSRKAANTDPVEALRYE